MENIDWDLIKHIIEIILLIVGSSIGTLYFIKMKNSNKHKQNIKGNNNNQAGGDIINVNNKK